VHVIQSEFGHDGFLLETDAVATSYAGHFAHEREFPISHEFIARSRPNSNDRSRRHRSQSNGWSIHNRRFPGSFLSATRSIAYDEGNFLLFH